MKKLYLALSLLFLPLLANADPVEIDGIYYNITKETHEAEVTVNPNKYNGTIIIPETVSYEGVKYNVTSIGAGSFWNCDYNYLDVTIGDNVRIVGENAFRSCYNLYKLTIGKSVASFGNKSFSGCKPDTVIIKDLEKWCYVDYDNGNGANPISYAKHVYVNDEELVNLVIPEGVTLINDFAFYNCQGIETVTIPSSVETIGENAFQNCINIKSILIGNGVKCIKWGAFSHCYKLEQLILPQKLEIIDDWAFLYCSGLKSVTIGNEIKSIGKDAFGSCKKLLDFYCYANNVPTTNADTFRDSPLGNATLYVPAESVYAYKTTEPWSSFMSIIAIDDDTTYPDFIYEIGNDGGWFISHPLKRMGDSGVYMGYCYLNGEFKFKESENDWNGNSWGLNKSTGKVSNSSDADNFSAEAGFYQVIVDLEDMTLTLNLISSIGVIGSYSGWSEDTDMAYDFDNNVWKVEHILFDQDENYFKFRANHSWDINWGGQPDNIILGGDNLSKGKGAYTIELRLSYEGNNRAIVNKEYFKLTYKVDDEVYKTLSYDYGATITPEPALTKEGYIFSGWSEIPETMPAHDVTVTGTFTVNKYKLIYKVDGAEYKSYELEYGATITPEPAPTKEGYMFSGWSSIPETMPARDVTVSGTFTINKYKLIYMVDGVEYKSYEIEYGATITPEAEPTKEGYTFSGWSSIPETMPAKDVTITGTFTKGAYKLTYMVDGEVYKTVTYDYGATITPEAEPTKEGYTFSGWSEIPATMPAKDVTVTGTFTINKYTLTFMVGENVYETRTLEYGSTIIVPEMPELTGYTFTWGEVPATMPAQDVTIVGEYQPNLYNVTYLIDGQFFAVFKVAYGSTITPPEAPERAGSTFTWGEYPETMPAHDIIIEGTYTLGINLVQGNHGDQYTEIYTVDGKKANRMQRGVNIIRRGSKVVKVAR